MNRMQKYLLLAAMPVFVGFALRRLSAWAITLVLVAVVFWLIRGPLEPWKWDADKRAAEALKWFPWVLGYVILVPLIIWVVLTLRYNAGESARDLPRWWGPGMRIW
jgi:hypothetical protein